MVESYSYALINGWFINAYILFPGDNIQNMGGLEKLHFVTRQQIVCHLRRLYKQTPRLDIYAGNR